MRLLIRPLALVAGIALAIPLLGQSATQLQQDADKAYSNKEYAKSAQLYREAFRLNPKGLLNLYNAACSLALAGQADEAFRALEELSTKGYNNPDQLRSDTDFSSLRTDARWAPVVAAVEENAKKNPPPPRWKKPFTILTDQPAIEDVRAKLNSDGDAVWLDTDVLSFAKRSSANAVRLTGGIQEPMTRIGDSDVWILRLRMTDWSDAFASYAFIEGTEYPKTQKRWRGPKAPELPPIAAPSLSGQIIERTIHSESLGEDRPIIVYLPPNAPKKDLPAVFMADGGGCSTFAAALEPLILAGTVRPCAIVGIPPGKYMGDPDKPFEFQKDTRAKEYLPNLDRDRFDRHLRFFTDEVGAYVAKEFGISTKREDRAITGFSNGGAFAATVAFRKPEFFAVAMPLSLGIAPEDDKPSTPMPDMYFAGGTLESFGNSTKRLYERVKDWGMKTSLDLYPAGHDAAMWQLAFSRLMPKAFPPKS